MVKMQYGGYIAVAFVVWVSLWTIWNYVQRVSMGRKERKLDYKRVSRPEREERNTGTTFFLPFYEGENIIIQPKPTMRRVVTFSGRTKKGNAIITWPKQGGGMSRKIIPFNELARLRIH